MIRTRRPLPRSRRHEPPPAAMSMLSQILKMGAILAAAVLLGNWFLQELRLARRKGKPWYAVYLTPPGILIVLAALVLPLAAWYFGRP